MNTSITRRAFLKRTSTAAVATVLAFQLLDHWAYADEIGSGCFCITIPNGTPNFTVTLQEGDDLTEVIGKIKDAGGQVKKDPNDPAGREHTPCPEPPPGNSETANQTTPANPQTSPPSFNYTFFTRGEGTAEHFICANFPLDMGLHGGLQ